MTERATPLRAATSRRRPPVLGRRGLPRLPRGYVAPLPVVELAALPLPPVVVVQAPQSFGKTTAVSWLLSQHDEQHLEHVWVSLPHREVSRREVWELIAGRLRDAGLADADWATLDRSMARRQRRLVIVVDNLDHVRDRTIDAELAELVADHQQINLIVLMREPRPIHVLTVPLDAAVVQKDDLILTADGAREMARQLDIALEPAVAAELTRQLRGWPALLRIVLSEPVRVVGRTVRVDQGLVDRYVRLLIRNVPDRDTRRALQVLSVPELLPHDLALELVGRQSWDQMAAFLDDLGLSALDISSRDPGPDPIRAAGATMLKDEDPELFREVSIKAAEWLSTRGETAAALRHATLAQDWGMVTDLLTQDWDSLLAQEPDLMRHSLDALPAGVVESNARLLVARDYILDLALQSRASAAYTSGVLVPGGAALSRSRRRLSLVQVLAPRQGRLHEQPHPFVETRDLAAAVSSSGWPDDVIRQIPGLLLEWAFALLMTDPGFGATYAFAEAAEWAEYLDTAAELRDAATGAAISHVVIGNPAAATTWLAYAESLDSAPQSRFADALVPLTRAMIDRQHDGESGVDIQGVEIPAQIADLEILPMLIQVDSLLREDRRLEAIRLLDGYRVRTHEDGVVSLAEHFMVNLLVETNLAISQVERARRVMIDADPDGVKHPAAWALVDFQSGEYQRVVDVGAPDPLVPRQALQLSLLRACAALRLQQRAVAVDAFQYAVSTATQTGMLRPFALVPRADLLQLVGTDVQARELLAPILAVPALLDEPQDGSGLSPRELQVLEAVATGASFAAVASRLFVSPNTVKSQMRDIYRKLGVRGREPAVERARELGLLRR